jgi:plasmid stabilization system protein ParE
MTCHVIFSPRALEQLDDLECYIEKASSPRIARQYVESIIEYCESLSLFPERGTARDDLSEGMRITHYRGRAIIAFAVESGAISILGVFYGGQDYAASL